MLEGRDIICFSSDWGGKVDSSHHLLRRFMSVNRVLWVNAISLRGPGFSAYDLRRTWKKIFRRRRDAASGAPGPAAVFSPRVLPFYGSRLARTLTRRMILTGLRRLMERLDFHDVIVWACVPTASLVVEALKPALVVSYMMDDYARLPGVNVEAMLDLERRLFDQSDLLFVTAEHLKEAKAHYGKPLTVLPHGVDFDHFHGPRSDPPKEIASVPHPIVGFFGWLTPWIDVELVTAVVEANPDLSFVFVGDVQGSLSGLAEHENVFFVPLQPYEVLPRYARHFDVSLLLSRITDLTVSMNPLKLMEYLALGAPVVSTRLPAVAQFAPHVRLADTAEEYSEAIRAALAEDSEEARAARLEIARANSWESRAEMASALVEDALAPARAPRRPRR